MLEEHNYPSCPKQAASIMEEINDKINYNFLNLCVLKNKT